MEPLDQTLEEVGDLYRQITGMVPPERIPEGAIPPMPAGADPLEFVLKEAQYLKDQLTSRTGYPSAGQAIHVPPVEAFLTADALFLKADLPGVSREDISLTSSDNVLVLRCTRPHQKLQVPGQFLAFERPFGTFERYIPLPSRVRIEAMKAKLTAGVLEIEVPLAGREEPPQKPIPIS